MARFYNPGQRIQEKLPYNNLNDPREVCNISYHLINAPEKDFFEVPESVTLLTVDGSEAEIRADFPREVKRLFAHRGVVLVNPRFKGEVLETDNIALTDAEAKVKGDAMYHEHLRAIVDDWFTIVDRAKAAGGRPRPAQGLHKYALKALNLQDPADTIDTLLTAQAGQVSSDAVQAQLAAQNATISKLEGMIAALLAQKPDATTQAATTNNANKGK
ncbi:MAG: hypothetical protein JWQ49_119 [Edaphobacter sp.]|nr:hypothetical protein [Edaphobacter sp.]